MGLRVRASVVMAVLLVACSGSQQGEGPATGDDGGGDTGADGTSPSGDDGGGADATTTVSQTVGASGGDVSAPGIALHIPAGALSSDTMITITPNAGPIPAGYTAYSSLYAFGPDGTTFQQPVTVSFTIAAQSAMPSVYWSNASGGYDELATTASGTTATASVTHFSKGFCGKGGHKDDAGSDASTGPGMDATASDAASTDATSGGDSATTGMDAAADGGSANDAGAAEASASDGGTSGGDAGSNDAGSSGGDAAATDAGGSGGDASSGGGDASSGSGDAAASDAGVDGIVATVDGVNVTFAANPSTTDPNGIVTVKADDNGSGTYWQLQIVFIWNQQQQACNIMSPRPQISYTHFSNTVQDRFFSTYDPSGPAGSCTLVETSVAQQTGQHSTGSFMATLTEAADAGTATHTISGTFDVIQ